MNLLFFIAGFMVGVAFMVVVIVYMGSAVYS